MKSRMKTLNIVLFLWIFLPGNLAAEPVLQSTAEDQVGIEVTVYNRNLGLIKDIRSFSLTGGQHELRFMDVAARILPSSVQVKSLNPNLAFRVLEQNYEYDLISAEKLLDKYVGKKIKIMDWNKFQDRKETVEAELLSNNQGQVYRIDNQIYLGHPGYKILPKVPENLIAKPTLTWLYSAPQSGEQKLQVSYLTEQISWRADYVLTLNAEDTAGNLSGWVTVDNQSGAAYKQARLKLVAGDIHQVQNRKMQQEMMVKTMQEERAPQFKEEAFFEYHLYDLQQKTNINNKQSKQIQLLKADSISLKKEFIVTGESNFFLGKRGNSTWKEPVQVFINLHNSPENGLGTPLPAGIVRLYKEDASQSLQFIGEDRIEHTPARERLKLLIGKAFDLVAERRQTNYRRISSRLHESEWEILLRNRKQEAVTISVIEPMSGNWQVLEASHAYAKQDAFSLKFTVGVQPDEEVSIKYKVRIGL